MNVQSKAAECN